MKSERNWGRLDMKSEWIKKKLSDIADFNPRETIKKGSIAKKISMDVLRPFCRDVPYYTDEISQWGYNYGKNYALFGKWKNSSSLDLK